MDVQCFGGALECRVEYPSHTQLARGPCACRSNTFANIRASSQPGSSNRAPARGGGRFASANRHIILITAEAVPSSLPRHVVSARGTESIEPQTSLPTFASAPVPARVSYLLSHVIKSIYVSSLSLSKLTAGKLGFNGGWEADATASAQRNARSPLNTNEHIAHITPLPEGTWIGTSVQRIWLRDLQQACRET
jgi:hypothetical protein